MNLAIVIITLSLEHIGYTFCWFNPNKLLNYFKSPNKCVYNIEKFLYFNKFLQIGCINYYLYSLYIKEQLHYNYDYSYLLLLLNLVVLSVGQTLNLSVYNSLGRNGVYYGHQFGLEIPWCTKFPYNVKFISHPQYIGACLSWFSTINIIKLFILNTDIMAQYSLNLILSFSMVNYIYMSYIEGHY